MATAAADRGGRGRAPSKRPPVPKKRAAAVPLRRAAPATAAPVKRAAAPTTMVVKLVGNKSYTIFGRLYTRGVPTRVDIRVAAKLLTLTGDYTGRQMFEEVLSKAQVAKAVAAKATSRPLSARQKAEREERRVRMAQYEDAPEEEEVEPVEESDEEIEAREIAGQDDDEGLELT